MKIIESITRMRGLHSIGGYHQVEEHHMNQQKHVAKGEILKKELVDLKITFKNTLLNYQILVVH